MNKGECVKRGLAWLLSVVMVSGMVPGTPGGSERGAGCDGQYTERDRVCYQESVDEKF